MSQITHFLKEAKSELLRVNWPTKQQTVNYTAVVIGISLAMAIFLGGLDYLFEYIIKTIILK